jgi:hypothetical protein
VPPQLALAEFGIVVVAVGRCSIDRLLDGVELANAIKRFFGDGRAVAAWTSKNLRRTCAQPQRRYSPDL